MINRYSLALAIALTLMAGSADAATRPAIPKAFQGTWYEAASACDDSNQYPVDIDDTGISSGEDSSEVRSVRVLGKNRIRIVTDNYGELTSDSPPGSSAYAGRTHTVLILSGDGQKLRIVFQTGASSDLKRCPAA